MLGELWHDAKERESSIMQEIFGPLARVRLFDGYVNYWRCNGKVIHVKVWPPVLAEKAEVTEPERDGVLRGRAWVDGRAAKRSRFFPADWSREKIEAAIIEAYGTRLCGGRDGWVWGIGGGLLIWLFLDDEGKVLYAQPNSRIRIRRRRDTRGCEKCGRVLDVAGNCPVGHDFVPAWMVAVYKFWKKKVRRLRWKLKTW